MNLPQPGDGQAMGTYTETYSFEAVGNLLTMVHQVSSGNWTRAYAYNEASQIVATELGNRLSATSMPGDPANGPFTATYAYDAHGNMTRMPHLPSMVWDEEDRLRATRRQVVNAGTPVTSYYVYGFDGGRVRKLTDGQAAAGQSAVRQSERIYLGAVELFRDYAADGTTISLTRETLHIDDGNHPIALVETRTSGSDPGSAQQVRYQFGNHLSSAILELDDQSGIISYEEYFPFGGTSYQAVASQINVAKRYRYTGKERDIENDLYYHGARYYAPWLGRWAACDPEGTRVGTNLYKYCNNNPTGYIDRDGRDATVPTGTITIHSDTVTYDKHRQRKSERIEDKSIYPAGGSETKSVDKEFKNGKLFQTSTSSSIVIPAITIVGRPYGRMFFVGGAGNDQIGWNYTQRFERVFTEEHIHGFVRLNESHDDPNKVKTGSMPSGDIEFTALYREAPLQAGGVKLREPLVEKATADILENLKNNPLREGEQLNLSGYSYGSVLVAHIALRLSELGVRVDNLVLIGSPIPSDSELFKDLTKDKNIGAVIRHDIPGDYTSNPSNIAVFIAAGIQNRDPNNKGEGPHFDLARAG
jgi:RHS repeat-associated protein